MFLQPQSFDRSEMTVPEVYLAVCSATEQVYSAFILAVQS